MNNKIFDDMFNIINGLSTIDLDKSVVPDNTVNLSINAIINTFNGKIFNNIISKKFLYYDVPSSDVRYVILDIYTTSDEPVQNRNYISSINIISDRNNKIVIRFNVEETEKASSSSDFSKKYNDSTKDKEDTITLITVRNALLKWYLNDNNYTGTLPSILEIAKFVLVYNSPDLLLPEFPVLSNTVENLSEDEKNKFIEDRDYAITSTDELFYPIFSFNNIPFSDISSTLYKSFAENQIDLKIDLYDFSNSFKQFNFDEYRAKYIDLFKNGNIYSLESLNDSTLSKYLISGAEPFSSESIEQAIKKVFS